MFQPAEAEPVAEAFDALRRDARIRTAMEELPPEQFQLVRAAFFEGLTQSEIAARDNIPLGTVKSRMRLAFTRLRRILEADDAVDTD
jgi:RNA polymerase sigma-70 factor (ECF subfamily)